MNAENQLWSIKRIANFLDLSVNYTRNVIVKQANFPEPRFSIIEVNGKKQKSKPRWIDTEISEWASQEYCSQSEIEERQPAKRGRKRKVSDEIRI
ncbi:hypothetical protein NX722_08610 [Endozoicomonas gorgoniicola]|uniref:AlpA family phage regulatory protein n=1 Tax=Endozoicomonas gorgoniicola TaxID=1234144 RepID=A0ABT3MTJ1_9GAMM|nr:hypothetical protein [Endozoicomonas gorgoniicola]MCW7552705.1 hypothetical protein [Endozoicomonas gorgoniicola]